LIAGEARDEHHPHLDDPGAATAGAATAAGIGAGTVAVVGGVAAAATVGGLAVLAVALFFSLKPGLLLPQRLAFAQEIETHLEDMSLISFRSESDGISVVWVNSR
jgi:hypothetical protein